MMGFWTGGHGWRWQFEIDERTVRRLRDRVAAGKPIAPDRTGAKGHVKLTDADLNTLRLRTRA